MPKDPRQVSHTGDRTGDESFREVVDVKESSTSLG